METIFLFGIALCICLPLIIGEWIRAYVSNRKQCNYRNIMEDRYGVFITPKVFFITQLQEKAYSNYFEIGYPYWKYANKDGSADLRKKENSIICPASHLYVDEFDIKSTNLPLFIDLVNDFRMHGIDISMNALEQQKYEHIKEQRKVEHELNDQHSVIAYYQDNPTGFEKFCADIFRKQGYQVELTPPVNDGGYDLILQKNGRKTIAECKCYAVNNKIGRPLIQKLVGANITANADDIMFITTSDYTAAAIEYACTANIQLINGTELLRAKHESEERSEYIPEITAEEWQISMNDVKAYMPYDLQMPMSYYE